jgi:methylase of polypeptide subunit release factors
MVVVAKMLGPWGRILATGISKVAIEVARINIERYGVM